MQSKLEVVTIPPPRICDLCGAPLGPENSFICTACREKRAAETPSLVAPARQMIVQQDLQGRVKPERPDRPYIVQEYAEHCRGCAQCSMIGRVRRSSVPSVALRRASDS